MDVATTSSRALGSSSKLGSKKDERFADSANEGPKHQLSHLRRWLVTTIIDWKKPKITSIGARKLFVIAERFTDERRRPATFIVAVVTDRPIRVDWSLLLVIPPFQEHPIVMESCRFRKTS